MCEFCTKHGEGKKWYLNAKNYSNDLLSDLKRRKYVIEHFYWIDKKYRAYSKFVKPLPLQTPIVKAIANAIIRRIFLNQKWAQVVPIEDVEKILSFTNSITRVPCTCRMVKTGKETRECFLISINPKEVGIADLIDQSYFGGPSVAKFERVDKKWAISFMKECEKHGSIHTVWSLKAPFIGAICNCDFSTGCIAMEMEKKTKPIFFKGEYLASIDKSKCVGCKECFRICPFEAIKYQSNDGKCTINPVRCYGCGICRAVCQKGFIRLVDRSTVPEAAFLWW